MREVLWPPCASALSNMQSNTVSHGPADVLDEGVWGPTGNDLKQHELPDPRTPHILHKVVYYDYACHLLPVTECLCCRAPIRKYKIALLTECHYVYPCDDCDQFVWMEVVPDDYR